jgi:hypothetical protein
MASAIVGFMAVELVICNIAKQGNDPPKKLIT